MVAMIPPVRRRRLPAGFVSLLTGSAAVALFAGGTALRGQAGFQGNFSVASGDVTRQLNGSTDTLTVNSATAVVNWQPYDTGNSAAPVDFLPSGSTGVFSGINGTDFTILNNIQATRPIAINGAVVSQIVDATNNATRGGNVWFYAPGGLVIGATGSFNVGGLILTTDAIDTTNGLPSVTAGVRFAGAAASRSAITIAPGATISAPLAGSYVAMVAPRIDQGGVVDVNGSVGYIAASAATVTINAGLFNISNTTGSAVNAGGETVLSHTGTTTGDAQTATTAPHTIYMVTVPQNDAVTMLVQGNAGYRAASSATMVNGTIELAAGVATTGDPAGAFATGNYPTAALGAAQPAPITIAGGTFGSQMLALSNTTLGLAATAGDLSLAGFIGQSFTTGGGAGVGTASLSVASGTTVASSAGLSLLAPNGVSASVDATGTLNVTGILKGTATTGVANFADSGIATLGGLQLAAGLVATSGVATGGTAGASVSGGSLTVTGATTIGGAYAGGATAPGAFGNATGGQSSLIVANDGRARFADLTLTTGVTGGNATGGTASLSVQSGGQIDVTGATAIQSDATARTIGFATSGNATGGTAMIDVDGGTANFAGLLLSGNAFSSNFTTGGTFTGGTVTLRGELNSTITVSGDLTARAAVNANTSLPVATIGGLVQVSTNDTLSLTDSTSTLTVSASALGGAARGGSARLDGGSGSVTIAGTVLVASAAVNTPGAAAAAQGGDATIGLGSGTMTIEGDTTVSVAATSVAVTSAGANAGYDAIGGNAGIIASTAGLMTLRGKVGIDASAVAIQSATVAFGSATGGSASIGNTVGGTLDLYGALVIDGSAKANLSATNSGVQSTGGLAGIDLHGDGMTLHDADQTADLSADAQGGNALAGEASINLDADATLSSASDFFLHARGFGGARTDATAVGYDGTGGMATVTLDGGTFSAAGLSLDAEGGGGGGTASGGNGLGGTASITLGGALDATGAVSVLANGTGGDGGSGAANATGGTAAIAADDDGVAHLEAGATVIAYGTGGRTEFAGRDTATQGIATGGTARALADGTGQIVVTGAEFRVDAGAVGGDAQGGSTAGTAKGGIVTIATGSVTGAGGTISAVALNSYANAAGGNLTDSGGTAGAATGGTASLTARSGTIGATSVLVTAIGTGGGDFNAYQPVDMGAAGGAATGGTAQATVSGGTLHAGTASVDAGAMAGAAGLGHLGGTGGAAQSGTAGLTVSSGTLDGGAWTVTAYAQGGRGGTGITDDSGVAGTGGGGGTGTSGTARYTQTGGTATPVSLAVNAYVAGGNGGDGNGFSDDPTSPLPVLNGGTGGAAGAGQAGTATIAISGGSFTGGTVAVAAGGTGATGGEGGDGAGYSSTTGPGLGGTGGAAGAITGGSATLSVRGVTATMGATQIIASAGSGIAGTGGAGGTDPTTGTRTIAASGAQGVGIGGVATLQVDAAGSAALGDTTLDTVGFVQGGGSGVGGSIRILATDTSSAAPATAITAASLLARNYGALTGSGPQLLVRTANPITVSGAATFVGDTATQFQMSGRGTLAVGGRLTVTAPSFTATQTNPAAGVDGIVAGDVIAVTTGAIDVADIVSTTGDLRLDAGGATRATRMVSAASIYDNAKGGPATVGTANAVGSINIGSVSGISVQSVTAGDDVLVVGTVAAPDPTGSARDVTIGSIVAGDDVQIDAWGTLQIGSVRSTGLGPDQTIGNFFPDDPGAQIALYGGAGVSVGSISTPGDVFLNVAAVPPYADGLGDLTVSQSIIAGGTVTALADLASVNLANVSAGSISLQAGDSANAVVSGVGPLHVTSALGRNVSISGDGDVVVDQAGDVNTTGSVDVTAAGDLTLTAAQGHFLTASAGGNLDFGTLSAYYGLELRSGAAMSGTALASTTDTVDLTVGGDATVQTIAAGDGVTIGIGGAGRFDTVQAGLVTMSEGNDGVDYGSLGIYAGTGLTVGSASALASIGLATGTGALSAQSVTATNGTVAVLGGGAITLGNVVAPQALYIGGPAAVAGRSDDPTTTEILGLLAASGPVRSGGSVTIDTARAGPASITAGGDLSVTTSLTTTGTATLDATGAVTVADLTAPSVTARGASVSLASGGALSGSATATGGDIALRSGTDLTFGDMTASGAITLTAGGTITLAAARAGTTLAATAGGLLSANGLIAAPTVQLTSGDIAIGANGAIGDAGSTLVRLANGGTGGGFVGAAGGTDDYVLDATELRAVHAAAIEVAGGNTLTIGGLTLTGSTGLAAGTRGNLLGTNGRIGFTASGGITLQGQVAVTNLAAGNSVAFTAGDTITGILPAAGIALSDANGGLAGTLALAAHTIVFATPDARQSVAGGNLAAIDTRFGASDGMANTAGYLRADTVSFTIGSSSLYTQNSGGTALADRAGVTAGSGGIRIAALDSAQSAPLPIVLNARIVQGGTTLTGNDVVAAIQSGSGTTGVRYASGSTVNGCLLTAASCLPVVTPPDTFGSQPTQPAIINGAIQPVQDTVTQVIASAGLGNASGYSFTAPALISLVGLGPLTLPPLIDEPVTGAGNDDLWVGVGLGAERAITPMGTAKQDDKPQN